MASFRSYFLRRARRLRVDYEICRCHASIESQPSVHRKSGGFSMLFSFIQEYLFFSRDRFFILTASEVYICKKLHRWTEIRSLFPFRIQSC